MKIVSIICFVSFLAFGIFVLSGCDKNKLSEPQNDIDIEEPTHILSASVTDDTPTDVSASHLPSAYNSYEEFESAVRTSKDDDIYNLAAIEYYYLPKNFMDIGKLETILVKDRYVCVYYSLVDLDYDGYKNPDEREIARISNTIKLEWVRNVDGPLLLESTVKQSELKRFSEGLYFSDIAYPTNPEKVLSKSFFWTCDGYYFNFDIPVEIFEKIPKDSASDTITALTQIFIKEIGVKSEEYLCAPGA